MLPLHCPPARGVGSLCAKRGLWGGLGTLTQILVVILCQLSQGERRQANKMQFGRGTGHPRYFCPHVFKRSLCAWSLRDSLAAAWALIPIQISEKSIGVRCLEIALLLRAWSGSCAIDKAEALCHPALIVPSAPQLCARELLLCLFLITFYCFAVLGLFLVLTRVVQGRQEDFELKAVAIISLALVAAFGGSNVGCFVCS